MQRPRDFDVYAEPFLRAPRESDRPLYRYLCGQAAALRRLTWGRRPAMMIVDHCRAAYWLWATRLYRLDRYRSCKAFVEQELNLGYSSFKTYVKIGQCLEREDLEETEDLGICQLHHLATLSAMMRPYYIGAASKKHLSIAQLELLRNRLQEVSTIGFDEDARYEQELEDVLRDFAPPAASF